jgi:hypothetical protein
MESIPGLLNRLQICTCCTCCPPVVHVYIRYILDKCTCGSVLVCTLIPTCPGVRGSAAHSGNGVDERNPGTAAVASLVPRHHRHEQVLYIIFKRVLDTLL